MKYTTNPIPRINSMLFTLLLSSVVAVTTFTTGIAQSTPALATDVSTDDNHNIDVATFDALRKNKDYVKLDVRASEAVKMNKLGGSVELDFSDPSFASDLEKLDKDKHYLVFSEHGLKSAKAVQMMAKMGFGNVSNLEGGFTSWMAADRPPE